MLTPLEKIPWMGRRTKSGAITITVPTVRGVKQGSVKWNVVIPAFPCRWLVGVRGEGVGGVRNSGYKLLSRFNSLFMKICWGENYDHWLNQIFAATKIFVHCIIVNMVITMSLNLKLSSDLLRVGWSGATAVYEPHHEKTCLRGLRPGKTQTGLLSWWD